MHRDMETLYFHSLKIVVKIHRNYTIIVTSNANGFIYAHPIHRAAFLLIAVLNRTAGCQFSSNQNVPFKNIKKEKKKREKKRKKRRTLVYAEAIPRSAMPRRGASKARHLHLFSMNARRHGLSIIIEMHAPRIPLCFRR